MNSFPLIEAVSKQLLEQNLMLVTAESCTGGLIAKLMTDRAGSSSVFERGFITYTNDSKIDLLDVSPKTLESYGAVSEDVAQEMALGAIKNSKANIAVSVTGIAGPGGGSDKKPVGLVYIGVSFRGRTDAYESHFNGSREEIRAQVAETALKLILDHISH